MIRDDRASFASLEGEAGAGVHVAGVEAAVIGHDPMDKLVGVVHRDRFPRLCVNGAGNEDVMLEHALRHRAGAPAEKQIGAEHIVPLGPDRLGVRPEAAKIGAGEMAEGAAPRVGRRGPKGAVGVVLRVFPFAVADFLSMASSPERETETNLKSSNPRERDSGLDGLVRNRCRGPLSQFAV